MNKIRIIIAEDKPLMRRTLAAFLNDFQDLEVVGESSNGRELLDLLKVKETDVVLLDLEMPVMGGIDVLRVMRFRFQQVKPIILSGHSDLPRIRECLSLGAKGFVSKDCVPEELIRTIVNVQEKGFYIHESTYKNLLQNIVYTSSPDKQKLSKRENEIMKELYTGKTEKQIATQLNISAGTVHFHRMNIYSKTGTHNLAELLRYISENNLI